MASGRGFVPDCRLSLSSRISSSRQHLANAASLLTRSGTPRSGHSDQHAGQSTDGPSSGQDRAASRSTSLDVDVEGRSGRGATNRVSTDVQGRRSRRDTTNREGVDRGSRSRYAATQQSAHADSCAGSVQSVVSDALGGLFNWKPRATSCRTEKNMHLNKP